MATNLVFRNIDSLNRVDTLADTVAPGTPVISSSGEPAVAVTGSGDYTRSEVIPGVGTLSGIPAGGVGLGGKEVSLAFDGTWEFLASEFDGTAPVPGTTTEGTAVNYKTADNKLTLAAVGSGVVAYGTVNYPKDYDTTRGFLPVKIGAR